MRLYLGELSNMKMKPIYFSSMKYSPTSCFVCFFLSLHPSYSLFSIKAREYMKFIQNPTADEN